MAVNKTDIDRYLRGDMTPAERHRLEREALRDPFLMEALEGANNIRPEEFAKDVTDLERHLGKQRTLFTPFRIAAGVAILLATSLGLFLLPQRNEQLAQTAAPDSAKQAQQSQASASQDTVGKNLLSLNQSPTTASSGDQPKPEEKQTKTDSETNHQQPAVTPFVADQHPETEGASVSSEIISEALKDSPTVASESSRKESQELARAKKMTATSRVVKGQVKDETGQPLPGVTVQVKDSPAGTTTDLNGYYQLETAEPNVSLVFSFVGLRTAERSVGEQDDLNVVLADDPAQLSEVVITAHQNAVRDETAEPVIRLAEPFGGRKAYDQYLDNNLRYPEAALEKKVKGRVLIEFSVDVDGSLDDFKVLRSLGYGCDEEVIRLVKEGPKWFPTTENDIAVESLVRVRMKFDPAKANK